MVFTSTVVNKNYHNKNDACDKNYNNQYNDYNNGNDYDDNDIIIGSLAG